MSEDKNRVRCNMYLDKESVDTVKEFIKDTGLSFSSYIDLIVCGAAEKIKIYWSNEEIPRIDKNIDGHKYVDILKAHKILGIADLYEPNLITLSQLKKIKKGDLKILINGKPRSSEDFNDLI